MGSDESGLIERCMQGDQGSYDLLYGKYACMVKAYLRRCGFSSADAEDLTQEVFVRVFKSLTTFKAEKGSFRGWVGVITRNVARKRWRRRAEPENFDPELAEEIFAGGDNPGQSTQAREEIEAVQGCVEGLAGDLARIVRLRYVEGRTTRGIAAAIDMAEATVRLRLKEAMGLLEECLKGKGVLG